MGGDLSSGVGFVGGFVWKVGEREGRVVVVERGGGGVEEEEGFVARVREGERGCNGGREKAGHGHLFFERNG